MLSLVTEMKNCWRSERLNVQTADWYIYSLFSTCFLIQGQVSRSKLYPNRPCRKPRKTMLPIWYIVNSWTYTVREIVGKLAKTACSFFLDARKWRGCLCRFYYRNGRSPALRPTRSRLYKRDHSSLRPNFDPLRWREFWKRHWRKRRSSKDQNLQA